jgi:hypothetical protein
MEQITEQQRIQQIRKEVQAAAKNPPDKQYGFELIQVGGSECRCAVIMFPADDVLLNPSSHRLRSQLESDPNWAELSKDKFGVKAQELLARYIRDARSPEQFKRLKDSLDMDGQEFAGVMTYKGVLINANTRAVAIRELTNPKKRYVKAAVLPDNVLDSELALLELRLQMQKELKEPYSLTNELLFIEEMYKEFKTPPAQIADQLRLATGRRGETEIKQRLKLLDFVRELSLIPAEHLTLRFFDEAGIKLQHLKDLRTRYETLFDKDPAAARRLLQNWLLSVRVGLNAVHKLREVDEDFDSDYMLPQLKQDEGIGDFAEVLTQPAATTNGSTPGAGVQALLGGSGATTAAAPSVAGTLLDLVTRSDKRIEVTQPGAKNAVQVDQTDVVQAIKIATFDGVSRKQGDDREDNKLEAPTKALKAATAALEKAASALSKVHDDPEFDKRRRNTLVAAARKHRRAVKQTEATFAGLGVPIE